MYETLSNDQLAATLQQYAKSGRSIRRLLSIADQRKLSLKVTVRNAATGFDPDSRNFSTDGEDDD